MEFNRLDIYRDQFDRYIDPASATVIGAGISGMSGLIGGILTNNANAREARKNRQWQTNERIAAQQWNEKMWNMENEYNDPSAQLQRMMDAGINPAAAAQAIAGAGSEAGSVNSVGFGSGAQATMVNPLEPISQMYGNLPQQIFQNKKTAAEAQSAQNDADNRPKFNELTLQNMQKDIDKKIEEIEGAKQVRIQAADLFPLVKDKTAAEVDNAYAVFLQTLAKVDETEANIDLIKKKQAETEANTNYITASTDKVGEDMNYVRQQRLKLEWEKAFRDGFGIDPTTGPIQQLIQFALSGEKGEATAKQIIATLVNTIKGVPEGAAEQVERTGLFDTRPDAAGTGSVLFPDGHYEHYKNKEEMKEVYRRWVLARKSIGDIPNPRR